jgi:deoxyribodipyrimidine photo-lyase
VFVLDARFERSESEKRKRFLYGGLQTLDSDLRKLGSRLFVKSGDPRRVLPEMSRSLNAPIFAEEDFTPFSRRRDQGIGSGTELNLVGGLTVFHPEEVLTDQEGPYKVYSRYRKKWQSLPRQAAIDLEPSTVNFAGWDAVESDELPQAPNGLPAGEHEASKLVDRFLASDGRLWRYGKDRSRVDGQTTSGLSPYIKFGMISIELLVDKATQVSDDVNLSETGSASVRTWLSELIWREFYQAAIYHFPDSIKKSLRPEFEHIDWNESVNDLETWRQGSTGYPIVDAAMRQLSAEGWIHNRCRMIVASFLVKDLLIDWRHGAEWFMKHLIDGDTAANIGGWQWTAGTGLDAAPYFRVFNRVLQGRKFDTNGEYVRKWIPELRGVADRYIHEPWESTSVTSKSISINGYPLPVVDHRIARQTTLEAFELARTKHSEKLAGTGSD